MRLRSSRARRAPTILPLLALLAACPRPTTTVDPLSAVDAYAAALHAGDYDRAYLLMSASYRASHSREEFVRLLRQSPDDARRTADRLATPRRRVSLAAVLFYGDLGDQLQLVEEGGMWRLAADPADFYPQDTPAHALRSFVRAIDLDRWDVVMRFVPVRYREYMTEDKLKSAFDDETGETGAQLKLLEANLDSPIEVHGDTADMQYGDNYDVHFVREEGVWKIDSIK